MQGATLEALVAGHPAGRAGALLQQRAYKTKGKESMALRMRATALEDQAAGDTKYCKLCHTQITKLQNTAGLSYLTCRLVTPCAQQAAPAL